MQATVDVGGDATAGWVLVGGDPRQRRGRGRRRQRLRRRAPLGLQLCFDLLAATATRLGRAGALEGVCRALGALCRQLLGYTVAVAVLVGGPLVKGGVGDGSS